MLDQRLDQNEIWFDENFILRCEEFWEPQTDTLERLVVNREIPIIHILMTNDPVDTTESGYIVFD